MVKGRPDSSYSKTEVLVSLVFTKGSLYNDQVPIRCQPFQAFIISTIEGAFFVHMSFGD